MPAWKEPIIVKEKIHSAFGASGCKRWIACPGSIRLSQDQPRKKSGYAEEGTAAHALAEECFRTKTNAKTHLYRRITLADLEGKETASFTVDEDMADAVQVYLDFVRGLPGGMEIESGMRVEGFPELHGTTDHLGVADKRLWISDYKHGKGVPVPAFQNEQLMYYAAGALLRWEALGLSMESPVYLTIIQPRANEAEPIDTWETTARFIMDWWNTSLLPAYKAAKEGTAPLYSGDHCRFCPAIGVCPAQAKKSLDTMFSSFEAAIKPPEAKALTLEQQVFIWQAKDRIEKWLAEIEANLKAVAETGTEIPGCKMVRGRRPNAKWIDETTAEIALLITLGKEVAYKMTLLTPTQAEKAAKESGLEPKAFEALIVRGEGVPTLAPVEDKRPALPMKAEREFSVDFFA